MHRPPRSSRGPRPPEIAEVGYVEVVEDVRPRGGNNLQRPLGRDSVGELERQIAQLNVQDRQRKSNARIRTLSQLISDAQELDLAFLVDATGSMQTYINSVKERAIDIAAGVKKEWPQLRLRVAFAPYRDYDDFEVDEEETCDFTNSFLGGGSTFVQALSRVHAGGGEDEAEDVFSGLERLTSLSWRSRTRVLVHIGDAPCHGSQFHANNVSDYYPEGDIDGRNIGTLLKHLRDNCQILCYLFCHVNDSTKQMLNVFKKHAGGGGNWIHEEKLSNINNLTNIVISVSTNSISQSIQVGDTGPVVRKFVNLTVQPQKPQWDTIPYQHATQIKYKPPNSLQDLFRILATNGSLELEQISIPWVQIANYPFSGDGSVRWPYHGILYLEQNRSRPMPMVVKRFKAPLGQDVNQVHAREAYYEQMEVQTVAAFMAKKFNEELGSLNFTCKPKTVQFTLVSTLVVGPKLYNMERFLEGTWIRYTNNMNYVNTKEYAATLHAFSHWTYERSNGLLMVTDLQGVQLNASEFWLCDPAVHCKDVLRYERTKTNWSKPGMKRFLEAHRCNNICQGLGLPPTQNTFMGKGKYTQVF